MYRYIEYEVLDTYLIVFEFYLDTPAWSYLFSYRLKLQLSKRSLL